MNEPRIATLSPDIKKQETHLARDLQDVLACLEENPSQKVWLEFYPFLTAFLKLDPFWPSYERWIDDASGTFDKFLLDGSFHCFGHICWLPHRDHTGSGKDFFEASLRIDQTETGPRLWYDIRFCCEGVFRRITPFGLEWESAEKESSIGPDPYLLYQTVLQSEHQPPRPNVNCDIVALARCGWQGEELFLGLLNHHSPSILCDVLQAFHWEISQSLRGKTKVDFLLWHDDHLVRCLAACVMVELNLASPDSPLFTNLLWDYFTKSGNDDRIWSGNFLHRRMKEIVLAQIQANPRLLTQILAETENKPWEFLAFEIISKLGELGNFFVPHLTTAFFSDDKNLRHSAGWALAYLRTPAAWKMLLDAATGDDVKLRDRTLWMLENHQPIPEAIPVIEKMLEVRCLPLHTLCSLTQMMARITPRTAELRTQLQELAKRIVNSAQTLPVSERHWCFEALAWIGPEAIEAVPLCVATIEEMALSLITAEPNQGHQDRRDQYEVSKAIKALGRLGSGAAAAVPTLKRLLTGDELLFRLYSHDVIKALARMGEPGITGLIEVLEECQGDWKEGYHWFEVDREFKKIGPSVIPKLCAAKDCPAVRERLLEAAYLFGPEAAESIPSLQKLLSHNDPEVRAKACAALGRIGPAASGTAANLHVLAEDTVLEVRSAAIAALGKIGRPGLTALKQLFTASLGGDRLTQCWVVAALKPFQSMKSVSGSLRLWADSPDASLRFLSGNCLD